MVTDAVFYELRDRLPEGSTWFREYYEWGTTPTFRLPNDELVYFDWEEGVGYVRCTWQEFRQRLLDTWRPVSRDGERLYCMIHDIPAYGERRPNGP
jgi:hypothetical protein